jgi:hypothetical protein
MEGMLCRCVCLEAARSHHEEHRAAHPPLDPSRRQARQRWGGKVSDTMHVLALCVDVVVVEVADDLLESFTGHSNIVGGCPFFGLGYGGPG